MTEPREWEVDVDAIRANAELLCAAFRKVGTAIGRMFAAGILSEAEYQRELAGARSEMRATVMRRSAGMRRRQARKQNRRR